MLDYSIKILNFFLFPFQDAFLDSEPGYVLLIVITFVPIVLLVKLVKEITS